MFKLCFLNDLWTINLYRLVESKLIGTTPKTRLSVLVGWSVIIFLKGGKLHFQTCFLMLCHI